MTFEKKENIYPEIRSLEFLKEVDGRWFVTLPEWKGDRADLEMVSGADTMLDILAQGEDIINVSISLNSFPGALRLTKIQNTPMVGGATYLCRGEHISEFELWLCDVTRFVFGNMPSKLYFK